MKASLMYLFEHEWLSFEATEWISMRLRRFRFFREG
jgi:hypothetical protein